MVIGILLTYVIMMKLGNSILYDKALNKHSCSELDFKFIFKTKAYYVYKKLSCLWLIY